MHGNGAVNTTGTGKTWDGEDWPTYHLRALKGLHGWMAHALLQDRKTILYLHLY